MAPVVQPAVGESIPPHGPRGSWAPAAPFWVRATEGRWSRPGRQVLHSVKPTREGWWVSVCRPWGRRVSWAEEEGGLGAAHLSYPEGGRPGLPPAASQVTPLLSDSPICPHAPDPHLLWAF